MDHLKIHNAIIENAKSKNRTKLKKDNVDYVYYENHHITPKCMGGTNDEENLVLLTAQEHFVIHKLLVYIHKGNYKLICAYHKLCYNNNGDHIRSNRDYELARSLRNNISLSKETKEKISNKCSGKNNGMYQ